MATVTSISPQDFTTQIYSGRDTTLIETFDVDTILNQNSYIEFYIYTLDRRILYSTNSYSSYIIKNDSKSTSPTDINSFSINPGEDVIKNGFNQGTVVAYYNFLTKRIGDPNQKVFISEISSDKTEIRLDSNSLTSLDIIEQTNNFINFREEQNYFVDFYLNLGNNNLIIANNIKLENENSSNPTILIKLYDPLPEDIEIKQQLWVVTTLNEPEAFEVHTPVQPISFQDSFQILGPNFNIPIKDEINNSSPNLSYSDIINGGSTDSQNQIESLISQSAINISVDYSNFNNFIHFSSAQTRIENFFYKASLIETYTSESGILNNITGSSPSILNLQNKISNVIKNFDKFEYFMYYSSGSSTSFPKQNNQKPYIPYSVTSSQALTWLGSENVGSAYFGGLIESASNFDNANPDQLKKAIPEYLRESSDNQMYDLFVDMVAQYYDSVWLYTKDITQKYNADNRLDFGISKDLVADAIKDFGLKLYQNNFSNSDLYTAFLGITPSGSLFPFPNITGSSPTPSGFEYVNTLISASNDIIPMDDVNKSLYKRIYHNIPYLLKSKGTIPGLRALITSYGIPDTILRISEFGGKDKVNENDYDYYFNNFNYALDTTSATVSTPWSVSKHFSVNPNLQPGTVEFRFKTPGIPNQSHVSQSLWFTKTGGNYDKLLVLEYTGSGLLSGSYNGSIPDPYREYGTLKYISDPGTANEVSCSVYLPFFDGGWWSVMVRNNGFANQIGYLKDQAYDFDFIQSEDGKYIVTESSNESSVDNFQNINLFAANKIYNGNDGTSIGFKASASINDPNASGSWFSGDTPNGSTFCKGTPGSLGSYKSFSGSIQEIRYYNIALGTTRFYDYTMNPLSIEGNKGTGKFGKTLVKNPTPNSSPNELTFRAALGSELDITTTSSIHPKITGSWSYTDPLMQKNLISGIPSFNNETSTFTLSGTPSYVPNTEYFFLDQPAVGIKNRITDKIRSENDSVPSGNVLSSIRSLSQTTEASASYTDNINYLEVAFSPQNQINDDIIGQIGHFNIGDYIGDPAQRFSGNIYPDLNNLSEEYFQKYTKPYDLKDFIRLIKFFDNSLFKMIKDFIPTRTSLASGLVIKQHLLERNKYPEPQMSFENKQYTGSIDMVAISGGAAGMVNPFNGLDTSPYGIDGSGPTNRYDITQSWSETFSTISGSVTKLHNSQDEFYDGEFSGSLITITNGELNIGCDWAKNPNPKGTNMLGVRIYDITSSLGEYNQNLFISNYNLPYDGYISMMNVSKTTSSFVPPPPDDPIPPASESFNDPVYIAWFKATNPTIYSSNPISYSSQYLQPELIQPFQSGSASTSGNSGLKWSLSERGLKTNPVVKDPTQIQLSPVDSTGTPYFLNHDTIEGETFYDIGFLNDQFEVIQGIELDVVDGFQAMYPDVLPQDPNNAKEYISCSLHSNLAIQPNSTYKNMLRIQINPNFVNVARAFNQDPDREEFQLFFKIKSTTVIGTTKTYPSLNPVTLKINKPSADFWDTYTGNNAMNGSTTPPTKGYANIGPKASGINVHQDTISSQFTIVGQNASTFNSDSIVYYDNQKWASVNDIPNQSISNVNYTPRVSATSEFYLNNGCTNSSNNTFSIKYAGISAPSTYSGGGYIEAFVLKQTNDVSNTWENVTSNMSTGGDSKPFSKLFQIQLQTSGFLSIRVGFDSFGNNFGSGDAGTYCALVQFKDDGKYAGKSSLKRSWIACKFRIFS
jgi:hypothetical protein